MHCPKCGQEQNSDEIRFCSKCGFDLKGVKELLAPEKYRARAKGNEARVRGFQQGAGLLVFGFVLTCVLFILREFGAVPGSYSKIAFMAFLTLGIARMCIPVIFSGNDSNESKNDLFKPDLETNKLSGAQIRDKSLPEAEYRPPVNVAAKTFDTNELVPIPSVTEGTTRNLEKEFQTK